ncbi:MAG: hypothetical protein ACRC62_32245 [Microcoleus sp.]
MNHPIPRFTDISIAPFPKYPERFYDADDAIHARGDRPVALDDYIRWFPHVVKEKESKGKRKKK